jgi:hypothetical protein
VALAVQLVQVAAGEHMAQSGSVQGVHKRVTGSLSVGFPADAGSSVIVVGLEQVGVAVDADGRVGGDGYTGCLVGNFGAG